MTIQFRNTVFVLAGAVAGFLSGLTNPLVFGVRGAIVGAVLSGATILLRPRLNAPGSASPPDWITVGLGIAAAAVATALIAGWHLFLPDEGRNMDFQMSPLSTPMRFATILCYTVPLLMFYRERARGKARAWAWFFGGPIVAALIRAWGYHQPGTLPFNLALGALPFSLLWLLAARLTDPAWTPQHRQKPGDDTPADPAGDPPTTTR